MSPRPSDAELAAGNAVVNKRRALAEEREAFTQRYIAENALPNPYNSADVAARAPTPEALKLGAAAAWKAEIARRIGESEQAEIGKIRSFLDAKMKPMTGEPPEAFEARKFATTQEFAKRKGIRPPVAESDAVGPVGYAGEIGRSLARGVTGVASSLGGTLPTLAGTLGERMGIPGAQYVTRGGQAVSAGIESLVPQAGIQPSMAAQHAGMLDPRFYAARLPETGVQLAATMAPGIGVAGLTGRAGLGVAAATSVGTALEASNAFEEGYRSYIESGIPEPQARQYASTEAMLYAPISALLETIPAGEFVAKTPGIRRRLMGLARGAFAEGSTEAAQQLSQDLVHLGVSEQEADWRSIGQRVAESGVLGAIAGGGLGAVRSGGNVPRGTSGVTQPPLPPPQPTPQGGGGLPAPTATERLAGIQEMVDSGAIDPNDPSFQTAVAELRAQAEAESKGVSFNVPNQEPPGRAAATDVDVRPADNRSDVVPPSPQPVEAAQPPPAREAVGPPAIGDTADLAASGAAQPTPTFQVLKPTRGEYSKRAMIDRIVADTAGITESQEQALDPEALLLAQQGRQAQAVADIGGGEDVLSEAFGGDQTKAQASLEMQRAGKAGRRRRAVEAARSGGGGAQAAVLAYQLDLMEENGPADRVQAVTNPSTLPPGTNFTISGVEHSVADRNGVPTLIGPKTSIPLEGVERMYVDEGSIGTEGLTTAVDAPVVDDLPISPKARPALSPASIKSVKMLQSRLRQGETFTVVEPRTRGDRQAVAVAKRLGIEPVFFEGNVPYEGLVDPENPGVVFLESGQTVQNVRRLLTHEWAHTLKKNDPQAFNDLVNRIEAVMPGELARSLERYRKRLRDAGMDDSRVAQGTDIGLEEAVAELLGDHADKAGFWSQLAGGEASVWQRIVDALRRLVTRVGLSSPVARELLRTIERAAARGGGQTARSTGSPMFSPAWHGSPHTFDKFSTSKIGTGEGNQAYGYGLYFAGKKEVAEHYKKTLSSDGRIPGEVLDALRSQDFLGFDNASQAMRAIRSNSDWATRWDVEPQAAATIQQHLDNPSRGRLYKVDLKPAEDEYLLWDKPLSEQSEKVRKALDGLTAPLQAEAERNRAERKREAKAFLETATPPNSEGWSATEYSVDYPNGQSEQAWRVKDASGNTVRSVWRSDAKTAEEAIAIGLKEKADVYEWKLADAKQVVDSEADPIDLVFMSGEDLYGHITEDIADGSDQGASEYLKSLGIRGIKYLDGTSRGNGDGTYNYVIFDDADVSIEEVLMSPKRKDVEAAAGSAGRPDLANPGLSKQTRDFIDALDELRKGSTPERYLGDDARAAEIAKNREALIDKMRRSVVGQTDMETVDEVLASKILVDAAASEAVVATDDASVERAYEIQDLYRQQGSIQSAKFMARRDPVKSGQRRMMGGLGRMLLEPSRAVQQQIDTSEKIVRDPNAKPDDVKAAKAELAKIKTKEIERVKRTKKAIEQAGLNDHLEQAERISKDSESAAAVAGVLAQKERAALSKQIFDATNRLNDAEQKLVAAQGEIAELKGDSAEVRRQRAELEKRQADLQTKADELKKEGDRLRRQRADISRRETELAQQVLNWAAGNGVNPQGIKVSAQGTGAAGVPAAPVVKPPKFPNMPGQQDLGGSENAGAITIKGGPETPTMAGGDVAPFTIGTQFVVELPNGKRLTAAEFYQLIKDQSTQTPWSDSAGATSKQKELVGEDGRTIDIREMSGNTKDTGPMADAARGTSGNQRVFPTRAVTSAMRIVQANKEATFWDKASEWWRNAVLSAPKTQSVNFFSTQLNGWYEVFALNAVKAAINQSPELFGGKRFDENSPTFREVKGIYRAASRAYSRAMTGFAQTWQTESPTFEAEIELATSRSLGQDDSDISYMNAPAIGGTVGRIVRAPQRLMAAADEMNVAWMTTITASMMAHRIANNEGLVGEAAAARIDDILEDASHPVWFEALEEARRIAFKTPARKLGGLAGKTAELLLVLRNWVKGIPVIGGPVSALVVQPIIPFVTTPANIIRAVTLATPLVSARTASRVFRSTVLKGKPGGIEYTGAMKIDDAARNAVAWGATLLVAALMYGGDDDDWPRITGRRPSDAAERLRWQRLGITPYSIKVGGKYVSYERLEPFASALALTIDMVGAGGDLVQGKGVGSATQRVAVGIYNIAIDKSYTSGMADTLRVIEDASKGRGDLALQNYLANYARAWAVPNLARATMRDFDPVVRETETLGPRGESGFGKGLAEKVLYGSVPSLAQRDLPPRYDLWGREIRKANDFGPAFGPFWRGVVPADVTSKANDRLAEIDLMIGRWNDKQTKPSKLLKFESPEDTFTDKGETVPMAAEEYAEYTRESGRRAAERIARRDLNLANPGEREYNIVRTEIRDARSEVKSRMWSARRRRSP